MDLSAICMESYWFYLKHRRKYIIFVRDIGPNTFEYIFNVMSNGKLIVINFRDCHYYYCQRNSMVIVLVAAIIH